ncbi:hypothetical protein AAFF_G00337080 [Aldrovandia affinis]|uniref:Uncharacterized protein n=1 Tax=Aldrovandia affinis TaxID=143900 RepID=A0AAD7WPB3_9TELE|nr:hypothetical protein AAFF_G00337080 [Aldrovandia affinis]
MQAVNCSAFQPGESVNPRRKKGHSTKFDCDWKGPCTVLHHLLGREYHLAPHQPAASYQVHQQCLCLASHLPHQRQLFSLSPVSASCLFLHPLVTSHQFLQGPQTQHM